MVQLADTQPRKVFIEAEILKQEFQRERHKWEMDVSKFQVKATGWRIEAEAKRSKIKKIVEERDIVTSNLKDLSL